VFDLKRKTRKKKKGKSVKSYFFFLQPRRGETSLQKRGAMSNRHQKGEESCAKNRVGSHFKGQKDRNANVEHLAIQAFRTKLGEKSFCPMTGITFSV